MSNNLTYTQWVNDLLDLYNYAKELDDCEWQKSIMTQLYESDPVNFDSNSSLSPSALWKQYEDIIQQMVALYDQARSSRNDVELEKIKERLWDLKQQRIRVAKYIQGIPVQLKKESS